MVVLGTEVVLGVMLLQLPLVAASSELVALAIGPLFPPTHSSRLESYLPVFSSFDTSWANLNAKGVFSVVMG